MALVYKRSTKNAARRYERSSGMEPNPGVNAMTVVNPGRPPHPNPFQWIEGRGQRHVHQSRAYEHFDTAKRWRGRAQHPSARLYPVDERGTIVSRPVPASLLKNSSRRNEMAYNIEALRRAMRANMSAEDREAIKAAARGIDVGRAAKKARTRRTGGTTETVSAAGATISSVGRKRKPARKGSKRKTTGRKAAGRVSKRGGSRRASARKGSKRTSRKGSKRKSKRGGTRRAAARKGSKRKTARKGSKRKSKRGGTRRAAARKGSRKSGRRRSRRGGSRRASKKWGRFFRRQSLRLTGREYIDKYLRRGVLPAVTRLGRSSYSRSGRPYVMTYPIPGGAYGRLSKRRTSKRGGTRRGYAVGATYRGRRKRKMMSLAANPRRRRSRRKSAKRTSRRRSSRRRHSARRRTVRRNSRRRNSRRRASRNPRYVVMNGRRKRRRRSRRASGRGLYANKRHSRRRHSRRGHSRRRHSRRRSSMSLYANRRHSRRRHSLRPNMLAASKVRWSGKGGSRMGKALGRSYQLVEYGPGSGKYRRAGYPVMVPPHVSMHGYVRKFRFGGAALDSHKRAVTGGYRERKRYPKSRRLGKNKRRTSMRRNPKYVVMNGRRRRRVRRNFLGTIGRIDWMNDVVTPVAAGTAGFVAARLLSNGLANVEMLRNALDAGAPAADARNTKLAASAVGIVATLGLATQVPMVRRYQGALVTGMGLAFADRLIQRFGGGASAYLSGFGEYVNQPIGEYVNQPIGEYVNQPMNGLGTMYATAGLGTLYAAAGYPEGIDPSDQDGVDGLMDTMEAAAGAGAYEAAAGMGATMGQGEADARLASMYAKMQPPFASIQTPTDLAREVTRDFPYDKTVPTSLVTPEGKGYAGGLFSRHLFAGMMGS